MVVVHEVGRRFAIGHQARKNARSPCPSASCDEFEARFISSSGHRCHFPTNRCVPPRVAADLRERPVLGRIVPLALGSDDARDAGHVCACGLRR